MRPLEAKAWSRVFHVVWPGTIASLVFGRLAEHWPVLFVWPLIASTGAMFAGAFSITRMLKRDLLHAERSASANPPQATNGGPQR